MDYLHYVKSTMLVNFMIAHLWFETFFDADRVF